MRGDVGYLRCMSHLRRRHAARWLVVTRAMVATLVATLVVALTFLVAACGEDTKLKVTGIEPKRGDFNGGQLVRVKGNRFTKDGARSAKVYFGSRQGTVMRFESDSEMIVQAPGGTPNETVDVLIVFEGQGEIGLKKAFTFVEPGNVDIDDLNTKTPPK